MLHEQAPSRPPIRSNSMIPCRTKIAPHMREQTLRAYVPFTFGFVTLTSRRAMFPQFWHKTVPCSVSAI